MANLVDALRFVLLVLLIAGSVANAKPLRSLILDDLAVVSRKVDCSRSLIELEFLSVQHAETFKNAWLPGSAAIWRAGDPCGKPTVHRPYEYLE